MKTGPYPTFEEPGREVGRPLVPFEPVTIDPGDSRYLVLQLRIEGEEVCTQSGGSFVPSDPGLRFRTLGIAPGGQTVPLPFTVVGMCSNEVPPDYDARAGR